MSILSINSSYAPHKLQYQESKKYTEKRTVVMHCLSEQENNQDLSSVGCDFLPKVAQLKTLNFLKNLYKITTKI